MLSDLRSVLRRYTVIELLIAFALATAVVAFVTNAVNGLVVNPILDAAYSGNPNSFTSSPPGPLEFVIHNRIFETQGILVSGLVLLVLIALAALYVRLHDDVLWRDEDDVATCPHCLSEIPAAARVCSHCTRDIDTPASSV